MSSGLLLPFFIFIPQNVQLGWMYTKEIISWTAVIQLAGVMITSLLQKT